MTRSIPARRSAARPRSFSEVPHAGPGFHTRAVHAGHGAEPRPAPDARSRVEAQLAALEGGEAAFAFASGRAACTAVLRAMLGPGDSVLFGRQGDAGSRRVVEQLAPAVGFTQTLVDVSDLDEVEAAAARTRPAVIWVHSPSAPFLAVADIPALARVAASVGAVLVVDNTAATPFAQQPLALGADVVVHSRAGLLAGHGGAQGGAVVVGRSGLPSPGEAGGTGTPQLRRRGLAEAVARARQEDGTAAGTQASALITRGLPTLGLRVERQSATALQLARWLEHQPDVEEVLYPGLPGCPQHAVARRQMRCFGAALGLRLSGGPTAVRGFAESTLLFAPSAGGGGVASGLSLGDGLVGLFVGLEDGADLKRDLSRALDHARARVEEEWLLRAGSMFAGALG
ncbi:trans-sulfuration enzyme family protein [Falsarthrobacter nasiphocae]|uniref:Cystathionine gamma-synthase n=1 Tax=Falsarthrobacter nasiphocae TaxID=189863 RepID=A0AAE3YGE6_9MICC|nr:PLP-dependent transferase [Falsarthrobacter nasiphocae]MDR6891695.1 cystathionine gamma-synthase [Falsarthrobacter nasiphocae]